MEFVKLLDFIKHREDKNIFIEAIQKGIICGDIFRYNNNPNSIKIKCRCGNYYYIRTCLLPNVIDKEYFLNFKPPRKSINMSTGEYFWTYIIKDREDFNIFYKNKDKIRIIKDFPLTLSIFNDKFNIWLNIEYRNIPSKINEDYFINFHNKIWTKCCNISQIEYFKLFTIFERSDFENFIKAEKLGIIKYKVINKRVYIQIKDCIKGLWWNLQIKSIPENIDLFNYIPNYHNLQNKNLISHRERFENYVLSLRDDYEDYLLACSEGIIVDLTFDSKNIYIHIKCSDTGNIKILYLKNVAFDINKLRNFKENSNLRNFIIPYEKAKKLESSINVKIVEIPLIKDNFKIFDSNPAICWVLRMCENKEILYVGEIKYFNREKDLFTLYENKDKRALIERRKRIYGINNSKLINSLFDYSNGNFECICIGIATSGDSNSVRILESIIDVECNKGRGAIFKQNK